MAETVKLQWSETRSDTRCAPSKRGYKDIRAHIYTNAKTISPDSLLLLLSLLCSRCFVFPY